MCWLPFVQEALKLLKSVATAMKLASMRLADSGFEEKLKVVKDRKAQTRDRVSKWMEGEGGGGGGVDADDDDVGPAGAGDGGDDDSDGSGFDV